MLHEIAFDQNISFRIVRKLQVEFKDCQHVSDAGLLNATDTEIWNYAKKNDYCIVTFDYDFVDFSILKGIPPKTIILKTGNTKTEQLFSLLTTHKVQIHDFCNLKDESSFLELAYEI